MTRAHDQPQLDLVEPENARSLLDQLLADAELYTTTDAYRKLITFVARLRNFAPFNAMLLHIQKPGLTYAASAADWRDRFGRRPKRGARPLLIMWPFGPVATVYDVLDTEGEPLPEDAEAFPARGDIDDKKFAEIYLLLEKSRIHISTFDAGDAQAGSIGVLKRPGDPKQPTDYVLSLNRNHPPATRFATVAHELAHLFLGHLGADKNLGAPLREPRGHAKREVEAESVAFIICERNGVKTKSETYLRRFVEAAKEVDVYAIMRAAGQIEQLLRLAGKTTFDHPNSTKASNKTRERADRN